MQFAGFWRRLAATVIDQLIILVPSYVVSDVVHVSMVAMGKKITPGWATLFVYLTLFLWAAISFFYFVILEGRYGTTAGKRLMNLKLVRVDEPNRDGIGIGLAMVRTIVAYIGTVFFYVGFLILLLDDSARTLQDRVLKTSVVHDRTGRFAPFDPDAFPKRRKYIGAFVLLLVVNVIFTLLQLAQGGWFTK